MRAKLNENPVFQAGLVGVLALAVGLMLLLRMGGSSTSSGTDTAATADPAATTASAAPTSTDSSATAPAPATASSSEAQAAPAAPATGAAPGGFEAGPGLPAPVVNAYDAGKAVVLLIVNDKGIDDRDIEDSVKKLESNPDAAVFVTKVANVSDYSRITGGVDLDRTPAMVVIRPKKLDDSPTPTAVVSYGFRGDASVEQALENALYKGPSDLPYYPTN